MSGAGKRRTIKVDALARVEGEGALTIRLKGEQVEEVALRIYEPPRFFEAFLRGRGQEEVADIVARICGICPVAYQMSACHALEAALGVRVTGPLRALRRLLYCGEWIESHILHVFLLQAPDLLGYDDALALAKDHPDLVRGALSIKKVGNELLEVLGGRAIHPVNVRLGGFHRAPPPEELRALLPALEKARDDLRRLVPTLAGVETPPGPGRDYELVALRHPDEYPMNEGRIVSNRGLDLAVADYEAHFEELHVAHSTALHSRVRARGDYLCGPLARFNLNFDRLGPVAREAAAALGVAPPCLNPFLGYRVRVVEVLEALEQALAIIRAYQRVPERSYEPLPTRAGVGMGCTEAPRGILWHRYRVDEQGLVQEARIVPPTSQNQACIEEDLRRLAPRLAALPQEQARVLAEHAVRAYDPCISCATHFLTLEIERGP